MYEQFFKLQRRPFAATPDPACFFSSEAIAENLSQLKICVEHGQGIGILTAPAGMGKTLICRRLVKDLGERFRSLFLGNSNFPTRRSLLQAILFELGVEPSRKDEQELRHELRSCLGEICHDYEALVLVVDEAHLFEAAVLEEIRTLVDFSDEGRSLVRVILSGQLELEERMTDRQFDAINQRTSTHVCVEPLSIAESVAYVRHRIEWTGGNPDDVFSEEGTLIIARASCGVPRCLNQLADHSLLLGFAADESPVSESTVREALEDLKQLPLHWNDVNDADRMIESCSEATSTVDAESLHEEQEATAQADATIPKEAPLESLAESASDEVAAPFAVFEFGGDDDPQDDDEGETLDEVATLIDVPVSLSADKVESEFRKVDEPAVAESANEGEFEFGGQPSPPVSEICGVVLDLSAEVCGVSEYSANASRSVEATSTVEPPAEETVADREIADDSSNETAVFEFGSPADEDESTSTETETGATEENSGESAPVTNRAEIESDLPRDEQPVKDGASAVDAVPTEEEEVLAEIASVKLEIADVTVEFDLDSEPAADADPVVVLDDDTAAAEISEPTSTENQLDVKAEGAGAESNVAVVKPAVEHEIVSDPYALIQEPLSAGIVWDVPVASAVPGTVENEKASEESGEGNDAVDAFSETDPEEEIAEVDFESADEYSAEAITEAERIEFEEAIFEESGERVSEELGEAIMRDWVEDSSESQDEQLDVVEAPEAELTLFAAETADPESEEPSLDDAYPAPVREIHPDRFIDAIVPMLGEIDDRFTAESDRADRPERAPADIEADLVEAISTDDADIEDEIGSAVLDMCLDAQWSLQQDRGERHEEAIEPAEQTHFEHKTEAYDIVEPEEPSSAASFLDQVSELSHAEPGEPTSSGGNQTGEARRQFGRLFSDLRRRST